MELTQEQIKEIIIEVRKIYMSYEVQKDCLKFMDDFVFWIL